MMSQNNADVALIGSTLVDMGDVCHKLYRMQHDFIKIANRTRLYKIVTLDELPKDSWRVAINGLTPIANGASANPALLVVLDQILLPFGNLVADARLRLRALCDKARADYLHISATFWPREDESDERQRLIEEPEDHETTRLRLDKQQSAIQNWLETHITTFSTITNNTEAALRTARSSTGIDSLSNETIHDWRHMRRPEQNYMVRAEIRTVLSTRDDTNLITDAYLDKWQRIRGMTALEIYDAVQVEYEAMRSVSRKIVKNAEEHIIEAS